MATDLLQLETPKAHQIIEGAKAVFGEAGYEGASMSEIAARAGVSKGTLYNYFPSKGELFAACVRRYREQNLAGVFKLDPAADIRATLMELGRRYLRLLTSPEVMSVFRMVIAEAPRFPELRRAFYEAGPRFGMAKLGEYLAAVEARGLLSTGDPELAAKQFLMLCRADLYYRRLLCLTEELDTGEVERVVGAAVELFIKGYAPAEAAGPSG